MEWKEGGVCAAKGFRASGLHVGVKTRRTEKKDLALIVSDTDCTAAALFTKNAVKAAHIRVDMEHLAGAGIRAAVVNSGNANACAPNDLKNANRMCEATAFVIGCRPEEIVCASTGVIGQELNIGAIEEGLPVLYGMLSADAAGSDAAACAIMTTDTVKKEYAVGTVIGGKTVSIGGIAKGSGMIHPNMGTMLCFLTTDCAISRELLKEAISETVRTTFNRISVDGDTSTNDTCCILANGCAGNTVITEKNADYDAFLDALVTLCKKIAVAMASDGEGAKHLITCTVEGAKDELAAETLSKSVISSTLTKAAIFGADANWGRVICAMGYSGESFDPSGVDIAFASSAGEVLCCKNGCGLPFDEKLAKTILSEHDIEIRIYMRSGTACCTCWGCDITYDYIQINGDYRT